MRAASLARRQLTRDRRRLLVAVAGVAFAVVLMLMQLGFRSALFASAVRFYSHLHGDIFLVSPRSPFLAEMESFSWRRLYEAKGLAGVARVIPVYTAVGLWKNPSDSSIHRIFIAGFDPTTPVMDLQGVQQSVEALRQPDVVLLDADSRPEFGPVVARYRAGGPVQTEVNNRRVSVMGLLNLGTSFGIDGNLITSDLNFLRLFPMKEEGLIQVGVIQLNAGVDPDGMRNQLAAALPNDVEVLTKARLMQREIAYWSSATPIGFIFAFGAIMGFVVGMVIVYQILFADVSEHLAEYATLKAMGYADRYLFFVVLYEAVVLAVLGYIPGLAVSFQLYRLTNQATHLPMNLNLEAGASVLGLTIVMCGISGLIAVRKVRSADPAEIF